MSLVKTITRALTHSLSPTLVETLSQTPEQRHYCYLCQSQGFASYCVHCGSRTTTETKKALHYANFYAAYYSDYYSDYYTKQFYDKNKLSRKTLVELVTLCMNCAHLSYILD